MYPVARIDTNGIVPPGALPGGIAVYADASGTLTSSRNNGAPPAAPNWDVVPGTDQRFCRNGVGDNSNNLVDLDCRQNRQVTGRSPALVKHTNCASTTKAGKSGRGPGRVERGEALSPEQMIQARRAQRFALQDVARELLPDERVAECLHFFRHRNDENSPALAKVMYSPEKKRAYYAGLATCGSVWTCPVCAAKITEGRLERLKKAVSIWDGSVFMVTLTLQHERSDKLSDLVVALKDTWRKVKSGRWWVDFEERHGLAGSISGFECTVSTKNGWHPHLHALFFSSKRAGEIVPEKVQAELHERYSALLAKHGRYASADRGVWVDPPVESQSGKDGALKTYVSKWGLEEELTKSPIKQAVDHDGVPHYSPFQLLELHAEGVTWAGPCFQEYAKTMKGKRQLNTSKGFWALFGLEEDKTTDEELAASEEPAAEHEEVVALTWSAWSRVKKRKMRAEVLRLAESDRDELYILLKRMGITRGKDGLFYCPDLIIFYNGIDCPELLFV